MYGTPEVKVRRYLCTCPASLLYTLPQFLSPVVVTIGNIILDTIKNSLYVKTKEREESTMASKLLACRTVQLVQSFIHIDLREEEQN